MNIQRNPLNGAWVISAIIDGYLVERFYMGYTRREAVELFLRETGGKG